MKRHNNEVIVVYDLDGTINNYYNVFVLFLKERYGTCKPDGTPYSINDVKQREIWHSIPLPEEVKGDMAEPFHEFERTGQLSRMSMNEDVYETISKLNGNCIQMIGTSRAYSNKDMEQKRVELVEQEVKRYGLDKFISEIFFSKNGEEKVAQIKERKGSVLVEDIRETSEYASEQGINAIILKREWNRCPCPEKRCLGDGCWKYERHGLICEAADWKEVYKEISSIINQKSATI